MSGYPILSDTIKGASIGASFGPVGAVIGGIGGLVVGLFDSSAQDAEQRAKDAQARRNRALAEQASTDALAIGESEIGRHKIQVGQLLSRQRAALGASGAVGSSGSGLDLQANASGMAQLDELTMRANAQREAWGYKVQGENFDIARTAERRREESAQFSDLISSVGMGIGAYSKYGSGWGSPRGYVTGGDPVMLGDRMSADEAWASWE